MVKFYKVNSRHPKMDPESQARQISEIWAIVRPGDKVAGANALCPDQTAALLASQPVPRAEPQDTHMPGLVLP